MGFVLEGISHDLRVTIPETGTVSVGRAADCDLVVPDVTVSRRHADLDRQGDLVRVIDLGSSNGTAINGAKLTHGELRQGDTVTFGKASFRLAGADATAVADEGAVDPEGTVVRPSPAAIDGTLKAQQLERILDLAKRLSGEIDSDRVIASVVELTFDLLPVDRVSLLLVDERTGELVPACSKSRFGDAAFRVPRSIARRTVDDKVPILTESAVDDDRFRSGSVMLQSVRGAIAVPLLQTRDRVLGVLYVDSLTAKRGFQDEDASMLFAFAGIAAVTLGKLALADEVRDEARIRANFERFFAPGVAERIARERGTIRLAGDRRPVAVLFSDIREFTSIAETMAPDALSALLTEYFTEMVDLIFEHGGTLDKFIGDAVLAVWGAPLGGSDDADRALAAAVAMQAGMVAFNRRSRERGRPELSVGIGINFGEVFAGYLGSERRLEYSVIGDTVNVASRLCDEAGPGDILVSDALRARLATPPSLERMADVALRNKRQAIPVYRVSPPSGNR